MMDGIGVARCYYEDVVAPLVLRRWPGLPHAAARLGSGSDVLGLDDELSRDLITCGHWQRYSRTSRCRGVPAISPPTSASTGSEVAAIICR
jgi:hypothetical protein